jgi:exopolysaccharide production protein ExoQ
MSPSLATLVYACGIAGLFYLDRDKSIQTSKALWLPVVYILAVGSRPVSFWLGGTPSSGVDIQLEGSPIDGAFFQILLVMALFVLVYRGHRTLTFLNANLPISILIYFAFCLLSVCWSDYPGPAIKKWIKAVGDVVMILIVLTDAQPVAALRRLYSRTGFLLLPLSLLFIKYFPNLGRTYDAWTGAQMNTGVAYDKNILGVITFVLLLGAVWQVLVLLRSNEKPAHRGRQLLAQGTMLVMGVWLLVQANSATSTVCFVLGAGMMLATSRQFVRRHPAAVHALVLSLAVGTCLVMLLGGGASAAQALGRNPTLTGRTEIWADVIPMAVNPVVGAGFESFWPSPRVRQKFAELIPGLPLNEAHNGYIEVYLNLGWMGLGLIGLILADGYRRAVKAFRREPVLGALLLAYVLTAITYSVTEAGFRMLCANWIFFLLAVIEAGSIAADVATGASPPRIPSPSLTPKVPARIALAGRYRSNYGGKDLTTTNNLISLG